MSVLERRLQLLLSHDQYDRVAAEAGRSGRSVNAVVRDALDRYLEPEHSWADGITVFLALTEEPGRDQAQSPGDLATELDEQFDRVVLAVPGDRS
ncbi:MAG: ribbon-helix-helix protein, CopG family [Actinobacteria bacterium]|nr:ribbon-helix-helix protein, CopG family [Actinomycetota bacterium]